MDFDHTGCEETLSRAIERLAGWRKPRGHWEGELSSSPLATAAAAFALATVDADGSREAIAGGLAPLGLDWLADHPNPDGGFGDAVGAPSNLSATALVWAALGSGAAGPHRRQARSAEAWIVARVGSTEPGRLADALTRRYGQDRTFSVPILTMLALAGRLGSGERPWRLVRQLPFELAAVPQALLKWAHLPVVSYALPALVAVGLVRHHHLPTRSPLVRLVRRAATGRVLRLLERIQPAGGGFLEAPPLTAFVAMSLAASGRAEHAVVRAGRRFLLGSVRPDGSWPIDTNLATWVTTLSVNALTGGVEWPAALGERERTRRWLLACQHRRPHPYTAAQPGGWAWTNLAGGVPDADDTAGALLALRALGPADADALEAVEAGARWLIRLQNRDGGIPTFCRGWGRLPFDRSGPDLTAHAVQAFLAWGSELAHRLGRKIARALARAVGFLARAQRADGSWLPLWFGNPSAPDEGNPTYGTARVVMALAALTRAGEFGSGGRAVPAMLGRGAGWLLSARNADGGWGGAPGVKASIEETAVSVDALARLLGPSVLSVGGEVLDVPAIRRAVAGGVRWLIERTDGGRCFPAEPIGLYFARLWYSERLYPLIFTISALGRTCRLSQPGWWVS